MIDFSLGLLGDLLGSGLLGDLLADLLGTGLLDGLLGDLLGGSLLGSSGSGGGGLLGNAGYNKSGVRLSISKNLSLHFRNEEA